MLIINPHRIIPIRKPKLILLIRIQRPIRRDESRNEDRIVKFIRHERLHTRISIGIRNRPVAVVGPFVVRGVAGVVEEPEASLGGFGAAAPGGVHEDAEGHVGGVGRVGAHD